MKVRSFRVPFSRVVPEDAHELEFGPDDYLVVRPIFGLPAAEAATLGERMKAVESDEDADALLAEVLNLGILEWSLTDEHGVAIPRPRSKADMVATLPLALAQGLYTFLTTYRGDGPNPSTRS